MKKGILFVGALVAFTFASCKKEYTCECTSTCNGVTATGSATATMKKKDAESWCETQKGSSSGCTYSCKLK